jgi:hypothetical protein
VNNTSICDPGQDMDIGVANALGIDLDQFIPTGGVQSEEF